MPELVSSGGVKPFPCVPFITIVIDKNRTHKTVCVISFRTICSLLLLFFRVNLHLCQLISVCKHIVAVGDCFWQSGFIYLYSLGGKFSVREIADCFYISDIW